MKITFCGRDTGKGLQIEGVTYFPGQVGELSDAWCRVLIANGEAVAYVPPFSPEDRVADAVVEHRDGFGKKRKAR